MTQIGDHGGLREWLGDVRAGIGFMHLGLPQTAPYVQPEPMCGNYGGAQLMWWFTPTCPKCLRLARVDEPQPGTRLWFGRWHAVLSKPTNGYVCRFHVGRSDKTGTPTSFIQVRPWQFAWWRCHRH